MRRPLLRLAPLSILPLLACADFVDLETFDALPAFEELDFSRIVPAGSPAIWELRDASGESHYSVVGGAGRGARNTLRADLLLAFDSMPVWDGIGPGCLPAHCYRYIVSLDTAGVHAWTTRGEVLAFLGAIDSGEEAALVAYVHGYGWRGSDKPNGAIRSTPAGFELLTLRTVSDCPLQVNRYLIEVTRSGVLRPLKEEVARRSRDCSLALGTSIDVAGLRG